MAPNNNDEAEVRARVKEASRENRLSFRNRAEQLLRRECKEEAKETCAPFIQKFAQCAQEQGLLVVINCRKHLKELNGCMAENNGEERLKSDVLRSAGAFRAQHSDVQRVHSRGSGRLAI